MAILMVLEFISNPSTTDVLMLSVVFLLFVMGIKKVMNVITDVIMVSVASIIIPLLGARLFGLPIGTDVDALATYALAGIAAYFLYLVSKKIGPGVSKAARVTAGVIPKGHHKEKVHYVERERPGRQDVRYDTPNRIVVNKTRPKSDKEAYKNYVVLEDREPRKVKRIAEPLPEVPKKKKDDE